MFDLTQWVKSRGGCIMILTMTYHLPHLYPTFWDAYEALDELVAGGIGEWIWLPSLRVGKGPRLFFVLPTEDASVNAKPEDFSIQTESAKSVYFIQAVSGGPIKIGKSVDPATRLAFFQIGCPVELRLLGVIGEWDLPEKFIHRFARLESILHRKFRYLRLHGEWFEAAPELVRFIARFAMPSSSEVSSPSSSESTQREPGSDG